jgi:pimeloyl-ACP methyl ester carboxylesterase
MAEIRSVIDCGSGVPVVLLHGFPEYAGVWCHQIEALSSRYRVIAPNLPGFNDRGFAELPSLAASQVAESLLTLLDERGLARAVVVGHDIGGLIAWWLASAYPKRVIGLATLSSPHPADFLECLREPTQQRRSAYIAEFVSDPIAFFDPDRLSQWVPDANMRTQLQAALEASDPTTIAAYYRDNLEPASAEIWNNLEQVRCPALVMFGDADPYIDVACFKNVASRVSGPLRLEVLEGKGHFLHTSEAETVAALLLSWIEDLLHD